MTDYALLGHITHPLFYFVLYWIRDIMLDIDVERYSKRDGGEKNGSGGLVYKSSKQTDRLYFQKEKQRVKIKVKSGNETKHKI